MGSCISRETRSNSALELDDIDSSSFHVVNIDDNGTELWSGQLNVTRSEIVLHRRNCEPTRWPLRSLRRYGYDTDLFSFEVGRRCATGEGIYAFRCRRAEIIFQTLQDYIQMSTLLQEGNGISLITANTTNTSRIDAASPISTLSGQPSQNNSSGTYILPNSANMNRASLASTVEPRRSSDVPDSDYLEPITATTVTRGAFNVVTHGFTSNSSLVPLSPGSLNSLSNVAELPMSEQTPSDMDKESMGLMSGQAKKLSLDIPPQGLAPSPTLILSNYMNGNRVSIEHLPFSPTKGIGDADELNHRTYVNVTPGKMAASILVSTPKLLTPELNHSQIIRNSINHNNNNYLIDTTHCYENLDLGLHSLLRGGPRTSITSPGSMQGNEIFLDSLSPTNGKVNYIVLDLDQSHSMASATSATLKRDSIQSSATPNASPTKLSNVFTRMITHSTTMHSMSSLLQPESPHRGNFEYVTIDFNKTVALSNSVSTATESEGARKTRHSSAILPSANTATPHNSVSD